MSQRARRRHSRSKGSVGKKVLLIFGAVFAIIAVGIAGAALKVKTIYDDAPDIDTLKPIDSGASTQVFAADGTSLGYIQNDILRTPVKLKQIPKDLQQATISIEDENFYEHGGVDYGAIVRAALRNAEAGEVRQGASTITQQLVRNLYIDNPKDTLERKINEAAMAEQYEDKYSKNRDPRPVPEHRLLRHQRRQDRGRRRGRLAGLLQQAGRGPQPLGGGAARRPAAGALRVQPLHQPQGGHRRGATRSCARCSEQGYITGAELRNALDHGLGLQRGYQYETRKQQYFFDFVQQELIDKYGLETARAGRAQGLHDARSQAAGAGRAVDRRPPGDERRRRPGLDRRRHRRDPGDGLVVELRRQPVQPRGPGQAPGRVLVQALRAGGGDRRRRPRPRHDLLPGALLDHARPR